MNGFWRFILYSASSRVFWREFQLLNQLLLVVIDIVPIRDVTIYKLDIFFQIDSHLTGRF